MNATIHHCQKYIGHGADFFTILIYPDNKADVYSDLNMPQNVVIANIGTYVALVEAQQLELINRLDVLAPTSGGAVVTGGSLDMKSNNIVNAGTISYTKMNPAVFGRKYAGGAAGPALVNSIIETSILPVTSTGSLVFSAGKLAAYHTIRFRAGMTIGVTGTPTLTLRMLLNGVAVATHILSPTTGAGGYMDTMITVTSPTNAMIESHAAVSGIATLVMNNTTQVIDTTVDNTLTFTGQWSVADPANSVTLGMVEVDWLQA